MLANSVKPLQFELRGNAELNHPGKTGCKCVEIIHQPSPEAFLSTASLAEVEAAGDEDMIQTTNFELKDSKAVKTEGKFAEFEIISAASPDKALAKSGW